MKDVFTIIEREGAKNYWCKIGMAHVNKDGSINVYLNALPINGKLQIKDKIEKESGVPTDKAY